MTTEHLIAIEPSKPSSFDPLHAPEKALLAVDDPASSEKPKT